MSHYAVNESFTDPSFEGDAYEFLDHVPLIHRFKKKAALE